MVDKPFRNRLVKTWGSTAALFGVGLMPCPDCGVPLILKIWPLAAFLALSKVVRKKISLSTEENDVPARPMDQYLP